MSGPLMDGVASVGGKVLTSLAREATLDWRIAADVVAAARAQSIRVNASQLRAALIQADVFQTVRSGDPASPSVLEKIDLIECEGWDASSSELLMPMLYSAAVRQVTVSESQGLIHKELVRLRQNIDVEAGKSRDLLLSFPQPLRDDLAQLRETFGDSAVERMCAALAPPERRLQVLRDWFVSRPNWLPESEAIDGWLGLLAMSAGLESVGKGWIDRALTAGVSPRAYWMVLVANIGRSEEQALAYLAEVRGEPLVEAVLTANAPEERERWLAEWVPTTQMQRALSCQILAQQHLEAGRLDAAVTAGMDGFHLHGFAGAGVIAAQAMIARSSLPGSQALVANLVSARALALEIRDARREAGIVSAESIVIAINASLLLMDTNRARSLFTPEPEGEATALESQHARVREAAATALIQIGEYSEASMLIADNLHSAAGLQVRAHEAELRGDDDLSTRLWSEAVSASGDWNEKASICTVLALRGIVDPFVDELRTHYPELAAEIDIIANLFQGRSGSEARAAAAALDNARIARALSKFYTDHGRANDRLRLAEQSARRWGDPDEWLLAATLHLQRGAHDKAIDRARAATKAGGPAWGERVRAAQVEVEATHRAGMWEEAVTASRALVELDPDSAEAAWSLVIALKRAAEDDQAFREWRAHEVCRVPKSAWQASIWLDLYQRWGTAMAPFSAVIDISRRFADDEQVRRLTVGALLLAPMDELDIEVDVVELAAEFQADFPDSPKLLQTVSGVSDDGVAVLAALDKAVGGPREPSELNQHAAMGTLPVGLISMFARRGYSQSLIERREAPRFAGLTNWNSQNDVALSAAIQRGAALDTTVALTLAMLPLESAEELVRAPAHLFGTYLQLRDAHDAARELDNNGGIFVPSTETRGPFFYEPSKSERSTRQDLIRRIITQLRQTIRSEPPALSLPERDLVSVLGPWSESIARAAEEGVPLWCDDAATRAFAQTCGVASFGTPELVEYLRISGAIPTENATAIEATLIRQHSVGINFRESSWDLAAALEPAAPGGLSQAIEFGGPFNAVEKISYAAGAIERAAAAPEALRDWSAVATRYLLSIGAEGVDIDNLAVFIRDILVAPWTGPHHLPFVFEGIRDSCGDRWYPALRNALISLWAAVRRVVAIDLAASYFIGQFRELSADDRQLVLEIVLRDAT